MTLAVAPTRNLWNHLNHVAHELTPGHTSHAIPTAFGCITTTSQGRVTCWADADPRRARNAALLDAHPHLPLIVGVAVGLSIWEILTSLGAGQWASTIAAAITGAGYTYALSFLKDRLPHGRELRDRDTDLATLLEHHPAPDENPWPATALPAPALSALTATVITGQRPNGTTWALHQPGAHDALDHLVRAMHEAHTATAGQIDDDLIHLAHALPDTLDGLTAAHARLTR